MVGKKNSEKYSKKLTPYVLNSLKSREDNVQFMLMCRGYFNSSTLNTWAVFHEPIISFFFSAFLNYMSSFIHFLLLQKFCGSSFHIHSSSTPDTTGDCIHTFSWSFFVWQACPQQGVGSRWSLRSLPTQDILRFCDSLNWTSLKYIVPRGL